MGEAETKAEIVKRVIRKLEGGGFRVNDRVRITHAFGSVKNGEMAIIITDHGTSYTINPIRNPHNPHIRVRLYPHEMELI